MYFYDVIIPRPLDRLYTYQFENLLECGTRIIVNIKGGVTPAVIYKLVDDPQYECKDITTIIDMQKPFFNRRYLQLIEIISNSYCCSLGEVLEALFNKKLLMANFNKGRKNKAILNNIYSTNPFLSETLPINNDKILYEALEKGHLINLYENDNIDERIEHYLYIINHYLSEGKQIKIICSDQNLCEHFVHKVSEVLSCRVEAFYSSRKLSFRKMYINLYNQGELKVLIGTRSILGIPGSSEGLIILENEEDEFYKQEESPYLHFRNVAIFYAKILNVPLILGSSMPSTESLYLAKKGVYNYVHREETAKVKKKPIKVIDMKSSDTISSILSTELYDVLYNNIKNNCKSVIISNKKGFSKHLICSNCGAKLMCDRCYIQATYYKSKNYCKCNYCGSNIDLICKSCGGKDFFDLGFGLEHIEEVLNKLFNKKIIKIDRDDLRDDNKDFEMSDNIIKGDYDILLGTFVILRRFKNLLVNTGAILGIDDLLSLPDFRIYEKTMKLLFKFVGHIDSFSSAENFYIQSYDKELILFKFLKEGKESFYNYEITRRKAYSYPPFVRLVRVILSSNKRAGLSESIQYLVEELRKLAGIEVIGPSTAPVFVLRNYFRYNFLIKSFEEKALKDSVNIVKRSYLKIKRGKMKCKIDIDPYSFT